MKITLDIADADIEAALQTAGEHGIGYWARDLDDNDDGSWQVTERIRPTDQTVTHKLDIERGLRMMYQNPAQTGIKRAVSKGYNPSAWDIHQADAFVQYAAFGELRYG